MRKWRFLDTGPRTAIDNIALDYALLRGLESHSRCTFRLREFSSPAVTVGYNQTVDEAVNREFCKRSRIQIARRLTGGGAIYVDEHCLGWEIVASARFMKAFSSNVDLFDIAAKPIVKAMAMVGLPAKFRQKNDIEVRGKKISGMAAARIKNYLIIQGTLLVAIDPRSMSGALKRDSTKPRHKARSITARVTSLEKELGRPFDLHSVKSLLKKSFETNFQVRLIEKKLSAKEIDFFHYYRKFFGSNDWSLKVDHDL
ncbi:MAG: biotin/lipoate A/B protein ligase family protein, partial [Candidatus Bathyarchaeia archaeon]